MRQSTPALNITVLDVIQYLPILDLFSDRGCAVLQHAVSPRETTAPMRKLCILHVVGSTFHSTYFDLHGG